MTHFNIINNLYMALFMDTIGSLFHLILIQLLTLMITSFRINPIWVNSKQLGGTDLFSLISFYDCLSSPASAPSCICMMPQRSVFSFFMNNGIYFLGFIP